MSVSGMINNVPVGDPEPQDVGSCEIVEQSPTEVRPHRLFYLSGEVVVFKVQDTLFKVDAALFTRGEDSALKTMMLTLPQAENSQEGAADSNPIVLPDDTPAEFESLVWGLYSHNLTKPTVSQEGIVRFIDIAKISHKYDLKVLENWATSGLRRLAEDDPAVRKSQAAPLLYVFALCDCSEALSRMLSTIREMLTENACSPEYIIRLIDVGQKFGLQSLVGAAYCSMLLKPRDDWMAESAVTRVHHIRLLVGYYMLSEYSLEEDIRTLKESFRTFHDSWGASWEEYATQSKEQETRIAQDIKVVDVVGRLRCLLEKYLDATTADPPGDSHKSWFRKTLESHRS